MIAARLPPAGIAAMVLVAGCTAASVQVSDSGVAEDVSYFWLASTRLGERAVYAPEDEKITLSVRLAPNLIAYYKVFQVEWVDPGGGVYLAAPARTQWGSHTELATSLALAGTPAARLPGRWRVRLLLEGRKLVEREFEIAAPAAERAPVAAKEITARADGSPVVAARAGAAGWPDQAIEE